ncbi:hypothetical protein OEZ86_008687 [Tetradesmus obliquus]|nr:hypothetical protein OEZ86_008687 [Tetradesmus obliquus]
MQVLRLVCSCLQELTDDAAEDIFSQRVLAAASCGSGAELLSRACLQQPFGLGYGFGSIFNGMKFFEPDNTGDVCFTATLLQDFYEYHKGAKVAVLFDRQGVMKIAEGACSPDDAEHAWRELSFGIVIAPDCTLNGGQYL